MCYILKWLSKLEHCRCHLQEVVYIYPHQDTMTPYTFHVKVLSFMTIRVPDSRWPWQGYPSPNVRLQPLLISRDKKTRRECLPGQGMDGEGSVRAVWLITPLTLQRRATVIPWPEPDGSVADRQLKGTGRLILWSLKSDTVRQGALDRSVVKATGQQWWSPCWLDIAVW